MTVRELIRKLGEYDDDAQVLFVSQPNWPFEYSIEGACARFEAVESDCTCSAPMGCSDPEDHDEDCPESDPAKPADGTSPGDVFLVEGRQLRYGTRAAWDVI